MKFMYKFAYTVFLLFAAQVCKSQTASFTFQPANGNFCEPATINFTQTATGSPSGYSWSFGNGQFSNAENPSISFNAAGTYTVTLTAIFENTTAQSSQTVTINPVIPITLTADRDYICTPGTINFTASASANISSYQFNFGDGSPVLNSAANTASHNYSAFGNYTVTVTATSTLGCTSTTSLAVRVQNPVVSGTVSPVSGCIPIPVAFSASVALPIGGTVTSYNWDFGDGATLSTTGNTTNHTYAAVGNYSASVSIVSNEGCTGSFNFPPVAYGIPPTNLVAYTNRPIICGSETAILVAKATNANSYAWDFGDGTTQIVNDTIAQHKYSTLGIKTVTVTPFFNGCAGASGSFTVEVVGVIVGFNYANTCSSRNSYSFTNTSQGNISTNIWTFGDGSPSVTSVNANHTYPLSGTFPTQLFIIDSITACRDSLAVNIYTARPSLINPDSALCRNAPTTFSINNNYGNPANSYTWNVLGQQVSNQNNPFTIGGDSLGNFTQNTVIINYGGESCPDTLVLNHPLLVRGPNLDFTLPSPVCAYSNVNIINNSAPFIATDSVRFYYWNYGLSAATDTIYQPRPISYTGAGGYNVKLVAIDKNGCKDSLTKNIIVNPIPYLRVVPQRDTLCLGEQATLIAFHTDTLRWSNAGTLSCANCDTTIATPTTTTNYVATAINPIGCAITDTARILIFAPFTAALSAKSNLICNGDTLRLNASPSEKVIRWSPPIGISDTTIYDPVVEPPSTTTYSATLVDSVGCFSSSASITIGIKSSPTVDAGPDQVLPYAASTTISPLYSSNGTQYGWVPPTNLSCNTCPSPTATALTSQLYIISVTSDSGCVAKDSINIFVQCKDANLYLPTAFSPNNDGINDFFYPMTRGISMVTKFVVYNRYGQAVFSRNNFSPNIASLGWSGKINNLPQDQTGYVYLMEVLCDQGQKLVKKGSFVLLR